MVEAVRLKIDMTAHIMDPGPQRRGGKAKSTGDED